MPLRCVGRHVTVTRFTPEEYSSVAGHRPLDVEPSAGERARITGLLGLAPVSIDDLVRLPRTSPAIERMVLLGLEIAGRLERHGGGLVSLL